MSSEQPPKRPARAVKRAAPSALPAPVTPATPHVASALAASSPWAYAPAPESKELALIRPRYGLFIDGQERAPASGEVVITYNPATEEPLAEVAKGGAEDADRAITAAERAYRKVWSKLAPRERAKYLYRISRILQERSREFAVTETLDSGKPIRESRDVDVPLAAAHFWYYAGWADKLQYAVPGRRPESHGVVGQVIPWNFPLLMLAWKIAPALAAGNTVVLKPASTTPLTALLFADVCRQADLPPGVVNNITGPGLKAIAALRAVTMHTSTNKNNCSICFCLITSTIGCAFARETSNTPIKKPMNAKGNAKMVCENFTRLKYFLTIG